MTVFALARRDAASSRYGRMVAQDTRNLLSRSVSEAWAENTYRGPDHSSRTGAAALAERIDRYWAERGRSVTCRLTMLESPYCDTIGLRERHRVYGVRSDMINGMPAGAEAK